MERRFSNPRIEDSGRYSFDNSDNMIEPDLNESNLTNEFEEFENIQDEMFALQKAVTQLQSTLSTRAAKSQKISQKPLKKSNSTKAAQGSNQNEKPHSNLPPRQKAFQTSPKNSKARVHNSHSPPLKPKNKSSKQPEAKVSSNMERKYEKLEQDYYDLMVAYEKSEELRKKQKVIIDKLRQEMQQQYTNSISGKASKNI